MKEKIVFQSSPTDSDIILQRNESVRIFRVILPSVNPEQYTLKVELRGDYSRIEVNTIYIVPSGHQVNISDQITVCGVCAEAHLNTIGIIDNDGEKQLSQTIDFQRGAKNSIGSEAEEVLMLGKNVVNITTPIIRCNESEVMASHSVSAGEIDEEALWNLQTLGLSRQAALREIIQSKLKKIIKTIPETTERRLLTKRLQGIINNISELNHEN